MSNGVYSLINQGIISVSSFVLVWLMTHLFGEETYGEFALLNSIILIGATVSTMGINEYLIKEIPYLKKSNDSVSLLAILSLSIQLVLTSCSVVLLFVACGNKVLAYLIEGFDQNTTSALLLGLGILFASIGNLANAYFSSVRELKKLLINDALMRHLLRIFLVGVLYLTTANESLIYVLLLVPLSLAGVFFISNVRDLRSYFFRKYPLESYVKSLKFSVPLIFTSFIGMLLLRLDLLVIAYYETSFSIAIYSTCILISSVLLLPSNALNQFVSPLFSSSIKKLNHEKRIDEVQKLYGFTTKWLVVITLIAGFGIIGWGSQALLLFSDCYAEGVSCLVILTISRLYSNLSGSCGRLMILYNYHKLILLNGAAMLLINLTLNIIMIPQYGITGAAISTLISTITIHTIQYLQMYFLTGYSIIDKHIFFPILIVGICAYIFSEVMAKKDQMLLYIPLYLVLCLLVVIVITPQKEFRHLLIVFRK